MSYNTLNLPDGTIEGHKCISTPTVLTTTTTLETELTATEDCLCVAFVNAGECYVALIVNGVSFATFGGGAGYRYQTFAVPILKGTKVKLSGTGTVLALALTLYSYA